MIAKGRADNHVWRTIGLVAAALAAAPGSSHLSAQTSREPPLHAARPYDADRLETWVDSVVVAGMAKDRIPGAAVVWLHNGKVVLQKAYGVADVKAARRVSVDGTLFRIGSITKLITALALVQLVDRGQLQLDAPVGQYVSDLATSGPSGEPILVRHLLSHTAGYDQIGLRRQVDDPANRPAIRAFLEKELVPIRKPGVLGVYDTYGMTLAGHLVERISGLSYSDFIRRNLFLPLGMKSSWVEAPADQRRRLATGYGIEDGEFVPQEYEWYVTLPASSVDATATDMARLAEALLGDGGVVLSPAMTHRIRTERLFSYGDMGAFSWGFWEDHRNGHRAIHHGGVMLGYSSELYLVPTAREGFFVAYNRDPETGPPVRLREALIDLLYQRVLPDRTAPRAEPEQRSDRPLHPQMAGVYANAVGCFTCAEGQGWPLSTVWVKAEGPGVISLYGGRARFSAIDSLRFRGEADGRELRFLMDDQGHVRYLVQGPNSFVRMDDALLTAVLGAGWRDAAPAPLVAKVYRANESHLKAAEAYASLAARFPKNGRYAFYEGFSWLHHGDSERAQEAFGRSLAIGQWVPWSHYYIAAAHAAAGRLDSAWPALGRALDAGFADANMLEADPWWNAVRETAEFRQVLARLKQPSRAQ